MKHLLTYQQLFEDATQVESMPTEKTKMSGGHILFCKNKTAPLLIVYGGIPVSGQESGGENGYMWKYVDKLKNKYHIFVASNHKVNGEATYKNVLAQLEKYGIKPSSKVLYLFSGGYRPGMPLLKNKAADFSKVLLVDIWMKGSIISDFYTKFAKDNPSKVKYYYTEFGANNTVARDSIAKSASISKKRAGGSMTVHMDTNLDAVSLIS